MIKHCTKIQQTIIDHVYSAYPENYELAIKCTTPEVLIQLSKDENYLICYSVSENLNTPKEALVYLSKNKSWLVRCNVATHKNTPLETLIELCKDVNKSVRCHAQEARTNRIGLLK